MSPFRLVPWPTAACKAEGKRGPAASACAGCPGGGLQHPCTPAARRVGTWWQRGASLPAPASSARAQARRRCEGPRRGAALPQVRGLVWSRPATQRGVRRYAVSPLHEQCGLVEWVEHTCPLGSVLQDIYSAERLDTRTMKAKIKGMYDRHQVRAARLAAGRACACSPPHAAAWASSRSRAGCEAHGCTAARVPARPALHARPTRREGRPRPPDGPAHRAPG